ncbi:MAG: hypothetical protein R3A12_19230 [Ignavibacteria bacterium]
MLLVKKENRFFEILKNLTGEPMVILLLAASILYLLNDWVTVYFSLLQLY